MNDVTPRHEVVTINDNFNLASMLITTCIFIPSTFSLDYVLIFTNSSAVVCPKLTVPDKGGVVPASCSKKDVEYGTRCVFYCGDGYELSGPRYTTCQADTSWSEIAPLSCVRGQLIRGSRATLQV